MQNGQRSRKMSYGWYLVAISAITLTLKSVESLSDGIIRSFSDRFGSSMATMLFPTLLLTRVGHVALDPIEGYLVDRVGPRRMIVIGYLVMGIGFLLHSQIQAEWQF